MPEQKPRYLYSLCRLPIAIVVFWLILIPAYIWLIQPLDTMSIMTVNSLQWNYFRTMLPCLVGIVGNIAFLSAWGVSVWLKRRKAVVQNAWAWRIGKIAGFLAALVSAGYLFLGLLMCGMPGNSVDPRLPEAFEDRKNTPPLSPGFKLLALNYDTLVPEFAQLAGINVGYDTMEWMERYYGPGYAYTGGHPQGAREWRSRETGWSVNADGFNYSNGRYAPDGRTIDFITVSTDGIIGNSIRVPNPSIPCLFMGCVRLGMTPEEVQATLRDKLPPPTIEQDKYPMRRQGEVPCVIFRWKANGYVRLNQNKHDAKTQWTASLIFVHERLVSIDISS